MGSASLRKTVLFVLTSTLILGFLGAEPRPGTIDLVLLVDKSLSMEGALGAAKKLAAEDLLGALLVPGDRLVLEAFYGKIDRLFAGTIRDEADRATAIRSLNALVADGRFTDIGAALDRASADLAELGSRERPKYVLLLTDERQEAPEGSPYQAPDFVLHHPALTWVRRIDHGSFREIVVGLDVGQRVENAAPAVMKLLTEPPLRKDSDFPPLAAGSDGSLGAVVTGSPGAPGGAAGQVGQTGGSGRAGSPKGGSASGNLPFLALGGLLALAALGLGIFLFVRRKKGGEEGHDS